MTTLPTPIPAVLTDLKCKYCDTIAIGGMQMCFGCYENFKRVRIEMITLCMKHLDNILPLMTTEKQYNANRDDYNNYRLEILEHSK